MPMEISAEWQSGYGVISHSTDTIARLKGWLHSGCLSPALGTEQKVTDLLLATDHLANAAMWTIAHMTYAKRVDLSGNPLTSRDFKPDPQGHMGGSLNMAVAFAGYLLANALSGHTRGWLLGQGHCVSAIEAINALTGDVSAAQRGRYDRTEAGLSQLVSDFYSYEIGPRGIPAAPLGSHVSAHTAGGISEGGYLGFAGLQYIHTPLPGERLVAFLSDGAFEEQRGSDWSPRWWRAEDSGFAVPVMILNGRRIEQRTGIGQTGGADWLGEHLRQAGFDPIRIDGHDPLAYAWAILEAEQRLTAFTTSGGAYPARLPYIIGECVKGFGFPGAGRNAAHNLPLDGNPATNDQARATFNEAAAALYVSPASLEQTAHAFTLHQAQSRPKESANPMANRKVPSPHLPVPTWETVGQGDVVPMASIDNWFVRLVAENPDLRIRIGNPDELRSNRMGKTLDLLKHRVNAPDDQSPEDICGSVITALNEEAVISAALANKGGLSLAVSYEAFAVKMLGALRQEIIFARRKKDIGQSPGWISIPLVLSSHTWENAKNEQSHQDPTLPEALLGEMSDTAPVFFPIDANTAAAALKHVYATHGKIACLVVPKKAMPVRVSGEQAEAAISSGAVHLAGAIESAAIQLVCIGAYQVQQALTAFERLRETGIKSCVTAILEPGRFRIGRDTVEADYALTDGEMAELFPDTLPRVLLSHTRPEPMLGHLRPLDGGRAKTAALGYMNRGGTLDVFGMLFANKCTWAHAISAAETLISLPQIILSPEERLAVSGKGRPECLRL